jgi:chromosome segregation ATPase
MTNMHLADVTIEGLKSYSEPTDLSFQPGIGVIVGNNGVGKSNSLDAILWTLGESDLARLRCQDKQELFFAGSKASPPATRIRVGLTMKFGTERASPSIRLVREMTRDGQDGYWIQDEPSSREDYQRELGGLGLSQARKTIIKQEQINDLLLLEPEQRFRWVHAFLGADGAEDVARRLREDVGPLFRQYLGFLFPLGEGEVQVLDQDGQDRLEIQVTLPGNRRRRAHQLSGGEKSVTSLALKLAIFEQLDSPFYFLDEVEPSLDYTNHKSMQALLRSLAQKRQLIMITHLRSTIELANTLHGVRTRWDGSSFMKFYFDMDEQLLKLYRCC